MTEVIGNVAIPSVQEVIFSSSVEQNEDYSLEQDVNDITTGSESLLKVEISFTLVEQIHPDGFSVEKQESEVQSLVEREHKNNRFIYNGLSGSVSVQSVDIPEEGESDTIREGTLNGLFLPWPQFERNGDETYYGINYGNSYGE